MELIIELDNIKDPNKKAWLLNTLKLMDIGFHESERRQTLEEYNEELEERDAEIDHGEYTTAEELKIKMRKW